MPADEDDSVSGPDIPADLPTEPAEYVGILYGDLNYAHPTQFWDCETAEVFEMAYLGFEDHVWVGSCNGVYQRVRGVLDRDFDPPRLIIEETLEARWSEPFDCAFFYPPFYESCHIEEHPDDDVFSTCSPVGTLAACSGDSKCTPVRFLATEFAGWKHPDCQTQLGDAIAGDPCEYPSAGDLDTCAPNNRCWNPAGDLAAPGVCVPYCDLTGELDVPCEGTCVRCSSSDEYGLCMTECSGDDCNIDAFC